MNINEVISFINDKKNISQFDTIIKTIKKVRKDQFNIGSKIKFGRENGLQYTGTITKINLKRCLVDTDDNQKFSVPFELCQLLESE